MNRYHIIGNKKSGIKLKLLMSILCVITAGYFSQGFCNNGMYINSTAQPHIDTVFSPEFADKWSDVYDYIASDWQTTIVTNKSLPKPFLAAWKASPTFFYFDNYFINLGALQIPDLSIYARNAVDNSVELIHRYGFVPNFNDPTGETRSQTPYLSMMVREVYEKMEKKDKQWLRGAYDALLKEYDFWTNKNGNDIEDHSTGIPELQHFSHHANEAQLISFYRRVLPGRLGITDSTISDTGKIRIASPYVAEAETMDFTPRFDGRAPDFAAVDLNNNLFLYEENFAWIEKTLGIKSGINWKKIAANRKKQIRRYLWSAERGLYMDYDFINKKHSEVACITTASALFSKVATKEQAKKFVDNLHLLEYRYGLTICEKNDYPKKVRFQFDYPASWAAFTVVVIKGLDNYGYKKEAKRIAMRFIDVVTKNYFDPTPKQSGNFIYEKYNAVDGIIDGEDYGYGLNNFFGFTAGGFIWCYNYVKQNN